MVFMILAISILGLVLGAGVLAYRWGMYIAPVRELWPWMSRGTVIGAARLLAGSSGHVTAYRFSSHLESILGRHGVIALPDGRIPTPPPASETTWEQMTQEDSFKRALALCARDTVKPFDGMEMTVEGAIKLMETWKKREAGG